MPRLIVENNAEDESLQVWNETAFVLVGPEEINAEERLRIQLWDSDRTSADDDLGRIELDLKELMHSPESKGKMWDRTDGFLALEGESRRKIFVIGVEYCCKSCLGSEAQSQSPPLEHGLYRKLAFC